MKTKYLYDENCQELAEHFFGTTFAKEKGTEIRDLAQAIQDLCEDHVTRFEDAQGKSGDTK